MTNFNVDPYMVEIDAIIDKHSAGMRSAIDDIFADADQRLVEYALVNDIKIYGGGERVTPEGMLVDGIRNIEGLIRSIDDGDENDVRTKSDQVCREVDRLGRLSTHLEGREVKGARHRQLAFVDDDGEYKAYGNPFRNMPFDGAYRGIEIIETDPILGEDRIPGTKVPRVAVVVDLSGEFPNYHTKIGGKVYIPIGGLDIRFS